MMGLSFVSLHCSLVNLLHVHFKNDIFSNMDVHLLPNANTCLQELELAGLVNSFEEFRGRLNSVLDNQKTVFGVI